MFRVWTKSGEVFVIPASSEQDAIYILGKMAGIHSNEVKKVEAMKKGGF